MKQLEKNMSDSNKGKLQTLISSSDLETVRQGFSLAKSLISSPADLFDLFDIPSGVSQPVDIVEACKELEHRGHIVHWIFTTLEEQGVQWAIERERLYLIDLDQYNGRPFTYYVNTMTKEQYMFWKDHGGTNMNKSLFEYLGAVCGCEFWPKGVTQDNPLTLEQAKEILQAQDVKEWYSNIPENIPDEAMILPKDEGYYQFNNVRSGWAMYVEDIAQIHISIVERINEQNLPIWSGTLEELANQNSDCYIPTNVKHTMIRTDEYFMDFFQSEKALLCASITKKGNFNIANLQIHEVVDENTGVVLNGESIYYEGNQLFGDWECFSAQPYEPSLYEGLNLYTRKE